jgi:hypothetical protein
MAGFVNPAMRKLARFFQLWIVRITYIPRRTLPVGAVWLHAVASRDASETEKKCLQ